MTVNCNNNDSKLSFYRISSIIYQSSKRGETISRERRNTWLANICRFDLYPNNLNQYRVCCVYFQSGMTNINSFNSFHFRFINIISDMLRSKIIIDIMVLL